MFTSYLQNPRIEGYIHIYTYIYIYYKGICQWLPPLIWQSSSGVAVHPLCPDHLSPVSPELQGYILLDHRLPHHGFLSLFRLFHLLMFPEVLDVFRVGQILELGVLVVIP